MGYTYKYIPIAINHSNMSRFRIRQSRACTNALQTFESVTLFTPVCAFSRTTFRLYLLSTSVQVILHFTLNASASFRLHNLYIYTQMIWLNLKTLSLLLLDEHIAKIKRDCDASEHDEKVADFREFQSFRKFNYPLFPIKLTRNKCSV